MKKEIKISHEEWIKEVFGMPERPKDSFTVNEIMKVTGGVRQTLYFQLMKKVERGELIVGKYCINGTITSCYSKNPKWKNKNVSRRRNK